MKKVVIAGAPASGKTTLAYQVRDRFNISLYHLDKIFWIKQKGLTQDKFLQEQTEVMHKDSWILDGGFVRSNSFDIRIQNAGTIIVFDLPKSLIMWRLIKRYFQFLGKKRPDMPERHNESLAIVWHVVKYVFNYPKDILYSKLKAFGTGRRVFIIKNRADEKNIIHLLNN